MKYIISKTNDTAYNVALEEYAFKHILDDDEIFMLWINEPSIIIGKNQNGLAEIDSDYVREQGIRVIRRISGGGAVYHDLNNLNYTLIAPRKNENAFDFQAFSQPVIEALANLGLTATFSGRNDIEIDGKKICGNAQAYTKDRVLHHGCILFNVDLSVLGKALAVKPDKIESKGVKSVRSRVTNIYDELEQKINIDEFQQAIFEEVKATRPDIKEHKFTEEELNEIKKLAEWKASWDWNYGKAPAYNLRKEKRFQSGNIEILMEAKHSVLKNITFYGDFFGVRDVEELAEALQGINLEENAIRQKIKDLEYPISDYFNGVSATEFIELITP